MASNAVKRMRNNPLLFTWLVYAFLVFMLLFEIVMALWISPWYYLVVVYFIFLIFVMVRSNRKHARAMKTIREKIRISSAKLEEMMKDAYEDPTDPW